MKCKKQAGLAGVLLVIGLAGCETAQKPVDGSSPTVPAVSARTFDRVISESPELVDKLRFGPASVISENDTVSNVRVPVGNRSNGEVPVRYQFRFLDGSGATLGTSQKSLIFLPANGSFFLESSAPPGTVDWRLIVEKPW